MNRLFPSLFAGWLGGAALALFLTTLATADEPPAVEPPAIEQLQPNIPQPVKLSEYWLGIGFRPLGEALRTQLALPEGEGMLVEQVMPGAPAARAEVKRHDVVLKANGEPLTGVQQLIDVVDAAKDGEILLEIVRGGKPLTIAVKPEKRPEGQIFSHQGPVPAPQEFEGILGRLQQILPGPGQPAFRGRFFNPGVILPPGAPVHAPLPGNLSVTIRKQGDEPAKIDVQRGDESWSVDENDLDSLPPDIGVHVERMLGGVPFAANGQMPSYPHPPIGPDGRGWAGSFSYGPGPAFGPDGVGRMEKRLEEMNRRIERLQKMMQGLRERLPGEDVPDKKPADQTTSEAEQKEV